MLRNSIAYYVASRMIGEMDIADDILNLKQALDESAEVISYHMENYLLIGKESIYLDDIVSEINGELSKLFGRPEITGTVIRSSLRQVHPAYQAHAATRISIENFYTCDEIIKDTQEHLDICLRDLYSECYADVVMILLTHCSFRDYYEAIFDDEYKNLKGNLTDEKWRQDEHNAFSVMANCCLKSFQSYVPSAADDYRKAIEQTIAAVLSSWVPYRDTFVKI